MRRGIGELTASRQPPRLMPGAATVIAGTALGWALFGVRMFRIDGDVGRHIAVGRYILDSGTVPRVDLFSHTLPLESFVPYEWLSEILFALADRLAGLAGVAVLSGVLFAASCAVVYRFARLTDAGPMVALAVSVLAMFLQAVHLLPRPHLFTTLFAAVFLLVLETWRLQQNWQWLALTVPLMWIWANLHGGFLVGFVILGVYLADAWRPGSAIRRRRGHLLAAATACLLATLLNPAGLAIWPHTLSYFGFDFLVDQTNEYRSPDFHRLYGKIFLVAILSGFVLLGVNRRIAGFRDLTLFIGWLAAGLISARNIPLFGVLAVPWYALWIRRALDAASTPDTRVRTALARFSRWDEKLARVDASVASRYTTLVVSAGLILAALTAGADRYRFEEVTFPVKAVDAFDSLDLQGNVFNEMPWGGYLLYVRDDIPVFIDGQTDFYGEELSKDYLRIRQLAPGALELLDKYEIDWVLLRPSVALPQALTLDADWNLVYEDPTAVVFARASARTPGAHR
jgi:hypothetical protein